MSYSGSDACNYLASIPERVSLHRKDNNDYFWSYKLLTGRRAEFAFDPRTKNTRLPGLMVRTDIKPPSIQGVSFPECLEGRSLSTALKRVFSDDRSACFKVAVQDTSALAELIEYLETA
ncbi:hypothetical protein [Halomonas sp.]|uniref:hypothetical protein n=1 Tax=Halomonas sp. TaxID=1486246 RepID=UPI00384DF5A4